jgi:hypothetical protein
MGGGFGAIGGKEGRREGRKEEEWNGDSPQPNSPQVEVTGIKNYADGK